MTNQADRGDTQGTGLPPTPRYLRRRPPLHRLLFLAFVVLVTIFVAHTLLHTLMWWLPIALVIFLILRVGPRRTRRL